MQEKQQSASWRKQTLLSSEYIANVTGHRGINFLNDYNEADEEEGRGRGGGCQKTKVYDLSGHERIRQRADDGNALNFNTMLDTQGWCKGPRRKNMLIYGARTPIS